MWFKVELTKDFAVSRELFWRKLLKGWLTRGQLQRTSQEKDKCYLKHTSISNKKQESKHALLEDVGEILGAISQLGATRLGGFSVFFFSLVRAGDQDALQHVRFVYSANGEYSHSSFVAVTQSLSCTYPSKSCQHCLAKTCHLCPTSAFYMILCPRHQLWLLWEMVNHNSGLTHHICSCN